MTDWKHKLAIVGPDDRPTLTREQIEAAMARTAEWHNDQTCISFQSQFIRALCKLALEGLDKHGLEVKDSNLPDITLGEACEEIRQLHKAGERLRAENERLQRERDGTRAKALEEAAAVADEQLGKDSFVGLAIFALREKPTVQE